MEEIYGDKVCKTYIPRSINFTKAIRNKKTIYDYAPGSHAAVQHMKLVDELLDKWEKAT
ncbi:ParA family protein [Methanosarcina mazei]|uniref:ParA family protein n=1 Tax=Methanosarcina mazei TaxID=2209 RepID=UPI0012D3BD18|nr:ParA family protein [Methanosarcina mazei]